MERQRQRNWILGLAVLAVLFAGIAFWVEINRCTYFRKSLPNTKYPLARSADPIRPGRCG
jgi:hypothetical protein